MFNRYGFGLCRTLHAGTMDFAPIEMLDRLSSGMLPFVDRSLRLLPPVDPARPAKWRFALVLGLCLLVHAGILIALLNRDADPLEPQLVEEIPIEVVPEIPAPPPEPPPPPKQEQKKQEQQKPKYEASTKPAFDAPRAQNTDKVEREAPEKETHAPTQEAQPAPQPPAEKPAQEQEAKLAEAPAAPREQRENQAKADEDKPDAEALKKAELEQQQQTDKKKSNSEAAKTKKPLPPDQKSAMAKQLAALAPTPDFAFGSASKPAPVSGGTENTTYLSILYGLIMNRMHDQDAMRSSPGTAVIFFSLDETSNITHQAIYKSSGFPDIDSETLAAVRRAAPFPPPPRNTPLHFFFSRDVPRGR